MSFVYLKTFIFNETIATFYSAIIYKTPFYQASEGKRTYSFVFIGDVMKSLPPQDIHWGIPVLLKSKYLFAHQYSFDFNTVIY